MGVVFSRPSLAPGEDAYGNGITGAETMPRTSVFSTSAVSLPTGTMRLAYFTPPQTITVSTAITNTTTQAAGATPTLSKMALFSVASDGALTRVAVTANDTAIWTPGTNTECAKAFTGSVTLTRGQRYAFAALCVTGAAAPNLAGVTLPSSAVGSRAPRISGFIGSQTDIAASYTSGDVASSSAMIWGAVV